MEGTLLTEHDSSWVAQAAITAINNRLPVIVEQLRPRIFPDGDKWCSLYGDNLQDGICGFGDTPALAVIDFENNFYNQRILPTQNKQP